MGNTAHHLLYLAFFTLYLGGGSASVKHTPDSVGRWQLRSLLGDKEKTFIMALFMMAEAETA